MEPRSEGNVAVESIGIVIRNFLPEEWSNMAATNVPEAHFNDHHPANISDIVVRLPNPYCAGQELAVLRTPRRGRLQIWSSWQGYLCIDRADPCYSSLSSMDKQRDYRA